MILRGLRVHIPTRSRFSAFFAGRWLKNTPVNGRSQSRFELLWTQVETAISRLRSKLKGRSTMEWSTAHSSQAPHARRRWITDRDASRNPSPGCTSCTQPGSVATRDGISTHCHLIPVNYPKSRTSAIANPFLRKPISRNCPKLTLQYLRLIFS